MNKEAKFRVGDEIKIMSTNEIGKITKIAAVLGEGYNLYVVAVDGKEKMYSESNLDLVRENNPLTELDVTDVSIDLGLDTIVKEIISTLNLREIDNGLDAVRNACVLQSYLALNKDYEKEWDSIGKSVQKNSIFHGIVNGDLDNISTALVFNHILKKLKMDVKCIACNDEEGNYYLTNIVNINDYYYYFDPYLEKNVYEERLMNNPNEIFHLNCAAIGTKEYCEFFKPLAVFDVDNVMSDTALPNNISDDSLDLDQIDRLFGDYYEG